MTNGRHLGLVRTADPASGEPDPVQWLGHRDLCSIQWSPICDCDPNNPIDLSEQEVPDAE